MGNYLFAVGCNDYQYYDNLLTAEKDVERIYQSLVAGPFRSYDKNSIKLRSPVSNDFRNNLIEALERLSEEDIFCFYFAGHGGIHKGSYYICLKDTRKSNPAYNGISLSELFTLVNTSQARHIYIILDSCQASGLVYDFNNLVKNEIVGKNSSKSFAILAASASNEFAEEDADGGLLTTHLLECLDGRSFINDTRKKLDLVEIGRYISNIFIKKDLNQVPTSWGLNLYGESQFATNPFFSEVKDGRSIYQVIPARSAIGLKISNYSGEIKALHLSLETEVSPTEISELLNKIKCKCFDKSEEYINFLLGISVTLVEQAQKSGDLFGASIAVSAFFPTLLSIEPDLRDLAILYFLKLHYRISKEEFIQLQEGLTHDKYFLISRNNQGNIVGDFFSLPIRISKILSWLSIFWTESVLFSEELHIKQITDLLSNIIDDYPMGFTAISESQAVHIYYALTFLTRNQCPRLAWQIHLGYLQSLANTKGEVIDFDPDWDEVASYFIAGFEQNKESPKSIFANPSSLLPALFLSAPRLGLAPEVDYIMHLFDGKSIYLYISNNHTEFGLRHMEDGFNFTQVIGQSFWTIEQFLAEVVTHALPILQEDQALSNHFIRIASIISSIVFEDRLPLFLELYPPKYS